MWVWSWAEGRRGAALFAGTENITETDSGSPSCGPDPIVAAFSERCTVEAPGAADHGFRQPRGEERSRQVAGPGSDTRLPGKFTEQASWDDPKRPRET